MKEIQATEKLVQKLERNCNRTVSTKVDYYHLVFGIILTERDAERLGITIIED